MPSIRKSRGKDSDSSRARGKKNNSLTCRNCRNRKIRCDGTLPHCGICQAYCEECVYDKAPPMSQILAMTERIAALEKAAQGNTPRSTLPAQDILTTGSVDTTEMNRAPGDSDSVLDLQSETGLVERFSDALTNETATLDNGPLTSADAYYETTSSVHAPETVLQQQKSPAIIQFPQSQVMGLRSGHTPRMTSSGEVRFWEEKVVESGSIQLHLSEETVRHLLRTHWTWVHPAFMFVDKETFLRDAATGGEFYSILLLCVLCLHSTRFTDHHLDEELLAKTRLYISHAMHQESSITSTQALLQHSAREIGRGNLSQAWMYSGMAFRMAIDLGLFTEAWRDYSGMGTEQARRNHIARQLAWSCFLWDKIISLYFGRHPNLPEPPVLSFSYDTSAEDVDLWQPYDAAILDGRDYPPVLSHKLSCFANFCKLGVIINDILSNIYGKQRTRDVLEFVRATRQRLQTWRNESPSALRIDVSVSGDWKLHTPPQHILTQNMLYYTTTILLYRPFRSNSSCRAACREAAEGVVSLLLRMEETFGLTRCTYVMAYCSYTAATVAVQDTKDGVSGAQRRLDTCVRALEALSKSCPGIQRSIDIISKCLASDATSPQSAKLTGGHNWMSEIDDRTMRSSAASTSADAARSSALHFTPALSQEMPAFPFGYGIPQSDSQGADGFGAGPDFNTHVFSHLDSYPQNWLNMASDVMDGFTMEPFN